MIKMSEKKVHILDCKELEANRLMYLKFGEYFNFSYLSALRIINNKYETEDNKNLARTFVGIYLRLVFPPE